MKPGSGGGKLASKASRSRTLALSKAEHASQILSTIDDELRKRKAHPNLSRICHIVQRQHKLTPEQTRAEVDFLASEKLVIKVDFKGTVSYRNAAKWRQKLYGETANSTVTVAGTIYNRNKTGRRVVKAVKNLTRQQGNGFVKPEQVANGIKTVSIAASVEKGVTINEIKNWIEEKWEAVMVDSVDAVKAAAAAEVSKGHLIEVSDGSYTLPKQDVGTAATEQTQKRGPGRPRNEDKHRGSASKPAAVTVSESETTLNNSDTVTESPTVPVNSVAKSSSQKKFGAKRKPKVKKNVDQEQESSPAKKSRADDTDTLLSAEPVASLSSVSAVADGDCVKCSYCQSSTNRRGNTEDVLECKDCHASIHPSCMHLSEELARRAARSPWQCFDCKTCNVCDDSGFADEMLFCDACDKGYHMSCHQPPVLEKPTDTDKWVCCRCVAELESNSTEPKENIPLVVATDDDNKVDDCGETLCLPTPNDSPVHFKEETVLKDMSPPPASSDSVVTLPKLSATLTGETPDASSWSVADVAKYFTDVGFVAQAETFWAEEIDGKALLLMTRNDVLTGMSFKLGPALKIYAHVQRLQTRGISLLH